MKTQAAQKTDEQMNADIATALGYEVVGVAPCEPCPESSCMGIDISGEGYQLPVYVKQCRCADVEEMDRRDIAELPADLVEYAKADPVRHAKFCGHSWHCLIPVPDWTDPADTLLLVEEVRKLGWRWAMNCDHNFTPDESWEACLERLHTGSSLITITATATTLPFAIRDAAHKALCP